MAIKNPKSLIRLTCDIPKDLHKATVLAAVNEEKNLKELVMEGMERVLKSRGLSVPDKAA